ncbi:MAG TPA: amylo-alpha-1,6-glucosidase [Candidatus Desulfovibrio intestinavium]|uniref:Amylo-alpha-1,6-glucosidase n=1 Tax=Candidatus Desulfovibrio intestinavium TaxID=2838534 RepID=A0A9D2HMM9_9BACT|nr:amylo-alpha-1,6-glucosidase [Candidatus Desulfovibrio intestinavium]
MQFLFDRPACQNLRKSLRREWLETNGLGDYASSSLVCCHTRKYHGFFVTELARPAGRHVMLSTLEESLLMADREFLFSCRKHPGCYYPRGHEYMQRAELGLIPSFRYRFGDVFITRQLMLLPGRHVLLVRYEATVSSPETPPLTLRVKPLLACRNMHATRHADDRIQAPCSRTIFGLSIRPDAALPELFLQVDGSATFRAAPDWYHAVEYLTEQERGFDHSEDLLMPGVFDIALEPGKPVYFTASTESLQKEHARHALDELWQAERARRLAAEETARDIQGHLCREGERFLCIAPQEKAVPAGSAPDTVVAGYHWFGAWGRDTLIALPGLTFFAGRQSVGEHILARMGAAVKDGLIPNVFSPDGKHAYNCVDASLWYIWAVQMLLQAAPDRLDFVKRHCWPAIRAIIEAYRSGKVPHVTPDAEGFLNVGDATTQLTWMDAVVQGRPVTSRHGQPVEISALWYNALAFADRLARRLDIAHWQDSREQRDRMRLVFHHRHWIADSLGDYLADVWREGERDRRVRPNQLFAVSLPFPILEEDYFASVVSRARQCLLTPYGLRTLAPSAPDYRPLYEGGPEARDGAYHQGTVWPWLLGAYGDALLRAAWDEEGAVRDTLQTLTPLFSRHLREAGIGSLSEIFDGDPPHLPDGCIAQAWSVAECQRLLYTLQKTAPECYARWERSLPQGD